MPCSSSTKQAAASPSSVASRRVIAGGVEAADETRAGAGLDAARLGRQSCSLLASVTQARNHQADENNVRRRKASTMNAGMTPDPDPPQPSTDTNAPVCHHPLDPPIFKVPDLGHLHDASNSKGKKNSCPVQDPCKYEDMWRRKLASRGMVSSTSMDNDDYKEFKISRLLSSNKMLAVLVGEARVLYCSSTF
ncbi:unnamed protein product [Urochloa humidicola]